MALMEFKDLPNTDTPITSANLNHNFDELKEYVLYQNTTGNAEEITLSETSTNFRYLEIYAYSDGFYQCEKVYVPTTTNFAIGMQYCTNDDINIFTTNWTINANKITATKALNKFITSSNTIGSYGTTPYIKIFRVIGYK